MVERPTRRWPANWPIEGDLAHQAYPCRVVVADAVLAQREASVRIVAAGGDYVWLVKAGASAYFCSHLSVRPISSNTGS